jgi:hypothetical protein
MGAVVFDLAKHCYVYLSQDDFYYHYKTLYESEMMYLDSKEYDGIYDNVSFYHIYNISNVNVIP